jgi:hypothetical protein
LVRVAEPGLQGAASFSLLLRKYRTYRSVAKFPYPALGGQNGFLESLVDRKHSTPNMTGDYFDNNNNTNSSSMVSSPEGDSSSSSGSRVTTLVVVGGTHELYISGTSEALVNSAKEVLEEFFSLCSKVK